MQKIIYICDYKECKREVSANDSISVTTGHSICPASARTEYDDSLVFLCHEHSLELLRQIIEKYDEDTGKTWFKRVTGRNR